MFQLPITSLLFILILSIMSVSSDFIPSEYSYIEGCLYILISLVCILKLLRGIRLGRISSGKTTFAWLVDLSSGNNSELRFYDEKSNPRGYKITISLFICMSLIFGLLGLVTILNVI